MATSTSPIKFNIVGIASAASGVLVVAFLAQIIYNLFFHPLRRFPGPVLHRATRLAFVYRLLRGRLPFDVLALHDRYGPVVRVAPNELAFAEPGAWKDIYGHRTGAQAGADEMPKFATFYRSRGIPPSLIAESRENHAVLRKQVAHGFSERAMREQEPIIDGYVALLVRRLREHCYVDVAQEEEKAHSDGDGQSEKTGSSGSDRKTTTTRKPKALDLKTWYNWTTFDVIGDLAFGEPFGCLEAAEYHPWVHAITTMIRTGAVLQAAKYLRVDGVLMAVLQAVLPGRRDHARMTSAKLERRMALDVERPDFMEGLLRERKADGWRLDVPRLRVNAGLLVIAGSETTATLLSGATYLLLSNPRALRRLTDEVRASFAAEDEITLTSVGRLSYMLACLNEALRRYPPVPIGMPRVVPRGGATVAGEFIPENTVVACWQWAQNHWSKNWEDPFSYRPERFVEGSRNAGDRVEALQPFSIGPRNCIGKNLAYAEMRLILARILFNFDMQLADPDDRWIDQKIYTLWLKPELNVYLTPVR